MTDPIVHTIKDHKDIEYKPHLDDDKNLLVPLITMDNPYQRTCIYLKIDRKLIKEMVE